jgi:DNA-binding MarR family transcriptional regulator
MTQPLPDPTDLLVRLLKLGSFISGPMRDGVCDPAGIGSSELRVIMALAGEGELAGHDLVEITGLPPMNVSRAIAALRERGWIEDASDPDNRRRRPVRLSVAGHEAYHRTEPYFAVVAEAILGGLPVRQRQQLATLTDRINDRLINWIRDHHAEVKLNAPPQRSDADDPD